MSVSSISSRLARPKKTSEMSRPLRPASFIASKLRSEGKLNTVEGIMMLTERISALLNGDVFDPSLQANITSLCQHLKLYGCHLEVDSSSKATTLGDIKSYEKVNFCQHDKMLKKGIIEAFREALYKEPLDRAFVTFRNACQDERLDYVSRVHLLQLIELRANQWLGTDHMSQYYASHVADGPLTVGTDNVSASSPTLLAPGELLRPSGKFPKPTRIPGKNYCKDEVVIRNADSGKVMGIKGRRVHMIEELSETIISFQRVAPGAKERLVQITGSNEESINHAKQLMEDTIRRNASPVRMAPHGGASTSSLSSSGDEESELTIPLSRSISTPAATMPDNSLPEFKYTVSVGGRTLRVTGFDLELVRTAKLVLDEYFGGILGDGERFVSANELWTSPWDEGGSSLTDNRLTYDAKTLAQISLNTLSRSPPETWQRICQDFPAIARKVIEIFDVEEYLKRAEEPANNTVVSATEMISSSPELE